MSYTKRARIKESRCTSWDVATLDVLHDMKEDKSSQFYRMPISKIMQIMLKEWLEVNNVKIPQQESND